MKHERNFETMIRTKRSITVALAAGAAALALGLTGCQPSSTGSEGGAAPTLRVWAGSQTPITANYNPFAPTVLHGALGPVYEPLFVYNKTADEAPIGLLGDELRVQRGRHHPHVTIKSGVKWNDGEDFTVDDVVYTFLYEGNKKRLAPLGRGDRRHHRRADLRQPAVHERVRARSASPGSSPSTSGPRSTTTPTFTDENPVGTGPYMVQNSTEASYTVVANENYREEGKPAVKKVQYVGIDANQSAQNLLDRRRARLGRHVRPEPRRRHVERHHLAR